MKINKMKIKKYINTKVLFVVGLLILFIGIGYAFEAIGNADKINIDYEGMPESESFQYYIEDNVNYNIPNLTYRDFSLRDIDDLVKFYNDGRNMGIWTYMEYDTSTWELLMRFKRWQSEYTGEEMFFTVGELNGEIKTIVGALDQGDTLKLQFIMLDTSMNKNEWSTYITRQVVELVTPLYEDGKITKFYGDVDYGVWLEGWARFNLNATHIEESIWESTVEDFLEYDKYQYNVIYNSSQTNSTKPTLNTTTSKNYTVSGELVRTTEKTKEYLQDDGSYIMEISTIPHSYKKNEIYYSYDEYLKELNLNESVVSKKINENSFFLEALNLTISNSNDSIIYIIDGYEIVYKPILIYYEDYNMTKIIDYSNGISLNGDGKNLYVNDIFDNVSLEYEVGVGKLKENLIFYEKPNIKDSNIYDGYYIIKNLFNYPDELTRDGLSFYANGERVFRLENQFIEDREGRIDKVITEFIEENGNTYMLQKIRYGWMTSDSKVYPLYLDPTIDKLSTEGLSLEGEGEESGDFIRNYMMIKFPIDEIPTNANISYSNFSITVYDFAWIIFKSFNVTFVNNQTWTESTSLTEIKTLVTEHIKSEYNLNSSFLSFVADDEPTLSIDNTGNSSLGLIYDYEQNNDYTSIMLRLNEPTTIFSGGDYDTLITELKFDEGDKDSNSFLFFRDRTNVTHGPILYVSYSIDEDGPVFSNFDDNSGILIENGTIILNVTIVDANETAGVEFNGVNYSVTNISNVYNSSFFFNTTGTFSYFWWASSPFRTSEIQYYTIKAIPQINFTNPTPANGTSTTNTYVIINVSIDEADLKNVTWTWNGTDYSIYDDSLVLMMNFDNRSELGESSSLVYDISGNGNNGIINGATFVSGKHNGAYDFDGINDYITITDDSSLRGMDELTITAWVNIDTKDTNWEKIIDYASDTVSNADKKYRIDFDTSADRGLRLAMWNDSNDIIGGVVIPSFPLNDWYFISYTYDGTSDVGSIKAYLNGELNATATGTGDLISNVNAGDLVIGKNQQSNSLFIDGTIDELKIWNRSLSADEIKQQYMSNLVKYNSSHWEIYVNQSNLNPGSYEYYASACDIDNKCDNTETRNLTIEVPIFITDCFDITSSGTYELSNDITGASSNCIDIQATDVNLDCKGYYIESLNNRNDYGIIVTGSGDRNVKIDNCDIRIFDTGCYYVPSGVTGVLINNSVSNGCRDGGIKIDGSAEINNYTKEGDKYGVWVVNGANINITNSYFDNSGVSSIRLENNGDMLIYNNIFNTTSYLGTKKDNSIDWNIIKTSGTNIWGGITLGGNIWTNPAQNGPSDTAGGCVDSNEDNICDSSYTIMGNVDHIDYLPLATNLIADTTLPSVSWISPSNNTYFSGTVTLTALATDDYSMDRVEFWYENATTSTTLLCTDTTDTLDIYTCQWDTSGFSEDTEGYIWKAVAFDATGNNANSSNVTLKVDSQIPSYTQASCYPTNGRDTVRNGSFITCEINVTDGSGSGQNITIQDLSELNGTGFIEVPLVSGSKNTGEWGFYQHNIIIDTTSGLKTTTVNSSDNSIPQNVLTLSGGIVRVDNDAPVVTSTGDNADENTYNNTEVRFYSTGQDDYLYSYIFSTNMTGAWVNDSEVISYPTTLINANVFKFVTTGNHSYYFYWLDDAGNMNASEEGIFEVFGPSPEFTVYTVSPIEGEDFTESNVSFEYYYENGEADNCTLILDYINNETVNYPEIDIVNTINKTLEGGTHYYSFACYDNVTNSTYETDTIEFTITSDPCIVPALGIDWIIDGISCLFNSIFISKSTDKLTLVNGGNISLINNTNMSISNIEIISGRLAIFNTTRMIQTFE